MSQDHDRLIESYLDGSITAGDAVALAQLVRSGGGSAVRRRIAFAGLLAQALDPADGEAVARSMLARIDAQGSASALVRSVQRSIRPRRRQLPGRAAWLALAAALTLAASWWLMRAPAPLAHLSSGTAALVRDGRTVAAAAGTPLRAGDRIMPDDAATVRWADGSELAVTAGSILLMRQEPLLELGRVDALIPPQPAGQPFAIATAEARIEVMGTRFHLAASEGRTRCDLHAGAVRMTRLSDGRSLQLAPEQSAEVAPGLTFGVWQALFPSHGLAGWELQYGTWSNDDGVRGLSTGGKIRLISERSFGDLELTCRMRMTGPDLAEIQVGDYNWFFEVPARDGAWTEVHLRQDGEALTCTADGTALAARPGVGRPARPGRISFYARSGSLELGDCRVLLPDRR